MNRLPKVLMVITTFLWLAGGSLASAGPQSNVNLIQAGDVVEARVAGYSEFNTKTTVSSNGTIIVPLIGDMQVAGLTEAQFRDQFRRSLSRFIKKDIKLVTSVTRTSVPSAPAASTNAAPMPSSSAPHQVPQGMEEKTSTLAPRTGHTVTQPLSSVADAYIIRPDDKISLDVWGYSEFNTRNAVVDYSGMIDIPLVGDVQAAGLTEAQLQQQLRQSLSRYIKGDVRLTTVITQAVAAQTQNVVTINPEKTITVMGAIGTQGNYKVTSQLPLLDVLSIAGGTVPTSDMKHVTIMSVKRGRQEVNVEKTIKKGNLRDLPIVHPGDTVYIPTKKNRLGSFFTYFATGVTTLGTVAFLYLQFR